MEENKLIQISTQSNKEPRPGENKPTKPRPRPAKGFDAITLCSATMGEDGKTEPPIGPLYIAATFEQMGIEVDFRDFQLDPMANGFSGEALANFLRGHKQVVAISCFVDMLPAVIDATRRLHLARANTAFLLGGPGPTASARRILEEYPWIAGVVCGEGEETVSEWIELNRRRRTGPISGMVYRDGLHIVEGPPRNRNRNLDDLPLPAYHLIDWKRYSHARVITTRGCSYKCSFCDVTALWGNRSVYRGLDATVAEMEMLRDRYGKNSIAIVDDTFVLNRERVTAFCNTLLERDAGIEWGCFGRINLMTPALIKLMAKAGCRAVFYGIDSGSQTVLDRTVKKVRAKEIMPVLELSAAYFDKIEASFIWGYPFETLADFKQTLELAAAAASLAPVVNVQLHMLSPLPMSPIYKEFHNKLVRPSIEDKPWLLLPPVLLDERSAELRKLVISAPDIYPGFYSFSTPAKKLKRELLERSMRTLDRTIGRTLFEREIEQLMEGEFPDIEKKVLLEPKHPSDRIGVGLAVAFFRRARRRAAFYSGVRPFEGTRGPQATRQRTEAMDT
ncbi:MAG: radical SAM protein [Acidobacteriota bacterium]